MYKGHVYEIMSSIHTRVNTNKFGTVNLSIFIFNHSYKKNQVFCKMIAKLSCDFLMVHLILTWKSSKFSYDCHIVKIVMFSSKSYEFETKIFKITFYTLPMIKF